MFRKIYIPIVENSIDHVSRLNFFSTWEKAQGYLIRKAADILSRAPNNWKTYPREEGAVAFPFPLLIVLAVKLLDIKFWKLIYNESDKYK